MNTVFLGRQQFSFDLVKTAENHKNQISLNSITTYLVSDVYGTVETDKVTRSKNSGHQEVSSLTKGMSLRKH